MKPRQRGNFHGTLGNKQYTCVGTDVECERTGDSVSSAAKNLPAMQEPQQTRVQSLGREDPLEEGMATHYSCLENPMDRGAWRVAVRTSQRVRHE